MKYFFGTIWSTFWQRLYQWVHYISSRQNLILHQVRLNQHYKPNTICFPTSFCLWVWVSSKKVCVKDEVKLTELHALALLAVVVFATGEEQISDRRYRWESEESDDDNKQEAAKDDSEDSEDTNQEEQQAQQDDADDNANGEEQDESNDKSDKTEEKQE